MRRLLTVGAGGLAREAAAAAAPGRDAGTLNIADDNPAVWGTLHGLTPVLGGRPGAGLVDHDVLSPWARAGSDAESPDGSRCRAWTPRR